MPRTTFYQKNFSDCWPPVHYTLFNNPDSAHWAEMCETAIARFDAKAPDFISEPDWKRFNSLVDAHLGEVFTWKARYEIYHAAHKALAPGVTVEAVAYAAGVLKE